MCVLVCSWLFPGGSQRRPAWGKNAVGRQGLALCSEPLSPSCLSFSPSFPPLSSILIVPQLAKSEPPSCEGLSLFFSQPPERQQAVSKSVPRVTSVEVAVRAGEEPRRRRLPHLAACQGRNTIHSQASILPQPAASRVRESAQPEVLFWHVQHPHRTECGEGAVASSIRPPSIPALGTSPFPICKWDSETNVPLSLHLQRAGFWVSYKDRC